jgi:predicted lactoylglutathione lyase
MGRKLFVNLAVRDLKRSVEFFSKLGFRFDPRFTDENATCMIVGDEAFAMLLVPKFFQGFLKKPPCDSANATEAILSFSVENRAEVDRLIETALAVGGSPAGDTIDMDFMYNRSFYDPDGHHWEVFWMDPAKMEQR